MLKAEYIANKIRLALGSVKEALNLFDQGGSVPFIARYRREVTGGLLENDLREIQEESEKFDALEERKKTVVDTITKLGKMTPVLSKQIESCDSLSALEDLYRPYKPKRETRGSIAIKAGLEPLYKFILEDRTGTLKETSTHYICEKYKTGEECIQGALDIWAEKIADKALYRNLVKTYIATNGRVSVTLNAKREKFVYDSYDGQNFSLKNIRPHQVLALTRGQKEKCLKVKFIYYPQFLLETIVKYETPKGFLYPKLLEETVEDSCNRLIFPSIENEVWNDLLDKSKEESLNIFAKSLKEVLLAPPLLPQNILGFDPGYAHGCKVVVIDASTRVLATAVVYPTIGEGDRKEEAKKIILDLVKKYHVGAVALGNGTAFRESYDFLTSLFKQNNLAIPVYSVSESGASIYSATKLAEKEFPNYDVNLRSSVSIARRLLDPLAELVKIPPESIGVGQYQHDLDEKKLSERLSNVVEDAVSSVGVDLNTASVQLLEHVSGLNKKTAQALVDSRETKGPFQNRKELLKVKGFGPKAFENAAGFLRINGSDPLDNTFIHPESYDIARKVIVKLNILSRQDALKWKEKLDEERIESLAKEVGTDRYTFSQILDELAIPHRDPRGTFKAPVLLDNVNSIKDLKAGMIMEGTVRNILAFGAFVDLGIHKDGLVHITEMTDVHNANPYDYVKIGQIVRVKVLSVDVDKGRISLSMKQVEQPK